MDQTFAWRANDDDNDNAHATERTLDPWRIALYPVRPIAGLKVLPANPCRQQRVKLRRLGQGRGPPRHRHVHNRPGHQEHGDDEQAALHDYSVSCPTPRGAVIVAPR